MNTSPILSDAFIPELPNRYKGKVRENYDLLDGRRIIIATDRLSAFDVILTSIPFKGQLLTQTARYWFEETRDICPNHVLDYPDPNVVVGTRLDILPIEIVVRSFLAGTTSTSILAKYKNGERTMYGIQLPDGLRDNEKLPEPIITPTSKAFDGDHDKPLSSAEILSQGLLTEDQWNTVSRYALSLFARGQARSIEQGSSSIPNMSSALTRRATLSSPTKSTRRIVAATGSPIAIRKAWRQAKDLRVSTRMSSVRG